MAENTPSINGETEKKDEVENCTENCVDNLCSSMKKTKIDPTKLNMSNGVQSANKFWRTQPMPGLQEIIPAGVNECIEEDKEASEIKDEPYNLPPGFEWETIDLLSSNHLDDLYVLLNENYVEDDDNLFRFNYSRDFLRWALMPPGWKKDWHVGVRISKTGKLFGFISAVPAHVKIYEKEKRLVEINFLCVHKKLRSKRLAPVLIKEITRRVNLTGIFQAVYTAGVVLPNPVSTCSYWHRSLNPKKLIQVKFSYLAQHMTMQRTLRLFKLPDAPLTPGFRKVTPADAPRLCVLLQEYLDEFDLRPVFNLEEFKHWFLPQKGVIDSYCVENDNKITDFVSYYHLDSTVMNHPIHNDVRAAYSFYYVATSTPLKTLMKDALISARNNGFDVFNALDLMENKTFMEELKFAQGDGDLQYYVYNWRCTKIMPHRVALVLQ